MQGHPEITSHICVTGQHRQMLNQVLTVFNLIPDVDLNLMQTNQTLAGFAKRAIDAIDVYLAEYRPDMILIQGDTTTVFCAALCAFYHKIPSGHVEAGLRTWNKISPFPEEINRVLTTRLADIHFAPTRTSYENLKREGVPLDKIFITGNTVIDALMIALDKIKATPPDIPGLPHRLMRDDLSIPIILITGHRRENFGDGFENICHAISVLAQRFPHVHFVYPVHLNPNVREPVFRILKTKVPKSNYFKNEISFSKDQTHLPNVHLVDPLDYLPFVAVMNRATLILTDSGGVQEEAPSLGKPVLVMRDTTERPEAVSTGTVKLVGTNTDSIVQNVTTLLTDPSSYNSMAHAVNPYGDGHACGRILSACIDFLKKNEY